MSREWTLNNFLNSMSFCKLKRDAIISVEFYLFQRGRLGAITREKKKYSIIRVKAQTDAM